MDDKVNYTLVGGFVLVLGAALVAAVLWLAAGVDTKKKYDAYQSILTESVAGLSVAAPVKYLGVDVGRVSAIGIDPADAQRVRVSYQIERGTPIRQDTVAVLKSQGLTGIGYVELSGGSPGSPPLAAKTAGETPVIRSRPSLSVRAEDAFTTAAASLNRTAESLDAILDVENRAAFKQGLADIARVAAALSAQRETLAAGIADAARTAHNTAEVSRKLDPAIARIVASADALGRMADETGKASASAGRAVDAASGDLRRFGGSTMPEVDRLVGEFDGLAASLRGLSDTVARDPESVLIGVPKRTPGPGEGGRP